MDLQRWMRSSTLLLQRTKLYGNLCEMALISRLCNFWVWRLSFLLILHFIYSERVISNFSSVSQRQWSRPLGILPQNGITGEGRPPGHLANWPSGHPIMVHKFTWMSLRVLHISLDPSQRARRFQTVSNKSKIGISQLQVTVSLVLE